MHFNWKNREFLSHVISFNYFPCFYLHPSRITEFCPNEDVWNRLMMYKTGIKGLSDRILAYYDLQGRYFYDFSNSYQLLAILPKEIFNRLLFFSASYINYKFITNTIEKNSLIAIKNVLGEELYNLVIQKAKFMVGNYQIDSFISDYTDISLIIEDTKRKIIENLFSYEPYSLIKRIEIRFPIDYKLTFTHQSNHDSKKGLWNIIQKILFQDINPKYKQFLS